MAPDKIYIREYPDGLANFWESKKKDDVVATFLHEYIRKDTLLEWVRLAYGKLSMNPLDVQDVFKELIDKIK